MCRFFWNRQAGVRAAVAGCEDASNRVRRRQPRQGRPICRKNLPTIIFKLRRSDIAHGLTGICRLLRSLGNQ